MSLDNGHYFPFNEDKKMLWRFQYNFKQELSKTDFETKGRVCSFHYKIQKIKEK